MYIEMNPTGLTLSDLICVAHRKRSEDTGFPYAAQSCRCSNCRYLKASPDIFASNNNQEVYDTVQKISVRYFIHKFPDYTFEKAFEVRDMISDLEAKYYASDLYFEQDTPDIYRPGIPHDQRGAAVTFIELMFYAISPDSYTKDT